MQQYSRTLTVDSLTKTLSSACLPACLPACCWCFDVGSLSLVCCLTPQASSTEAKQSFTTMIGHITACIMCTEIPRTFFTTRAAAIVRAEITPTAVLA